MKIVTGYTGTPHISSNDDQGRNQGIFGTRNYILDVGHRLNATLTNTTTVTLEDGEGIMQGVHFRIEPGTTDVVQISPGTNGYNRIDLICAKYTKDASTGIEDVSLAVLEGTPTASTPSAPSYTQGDILDGDLVAYFPLWVVTLTGSSSTVLSRSVSYLANGWKKYEGAEHTTAVTTSSSSIVETFTVPTGSKWEVSGVVNGTPATTSIGTLIVSVDDVAILLQADATGMAIVNFHTIVDSGSVIKVAAMATGANGNIKTKLTLFYRETSAW